MKNTVSCIIPFFNEGVRILSILDTITNIEEIDQIICVNDGSFDRAWNVIKKMYPQVILFNSIHNKGKSEAVAKGLKRASGQYIFLIDADIQFLKPRDLKEAIHEIKNSKDIGMIILKRNNNIFDKYITRNCIVLSGERIIRKADLEAILKSKPKKLQLEVAINKYLMENNQQSFWFKTSIKNISKIRKYGLLPGLASMITTPYLIFSYTGPFGYLKQMFFFCRKSLPRG